MTYQQRIAAIVPSANARHVEAFMRAQYETLDGLSLEEFARESIAGAELAKEDPAMFEQLARSYGL